MPHNLYHSFKIKKRTFDKRSLCRLADCLPCNGHIQLILNFLNPGYTLVIDEDSARENKALFVKIIEDDSAAFDAKLSEDYSQDR